MNELMLVLFLIYNWETAQNISIINTVQVQSYEVEQTFKKE